MMLPYILKKNIKQALAKLLEPLSLAKNGFELVAGDSCKGLYKRRS
ncbi:hypothetical protein LGL02_16255 [Clostridium estertheticum]|nr:hypothetical protein [Clostridium estertheticum]MCB2308128.1 hypothetical protein [Clostridium estertheticum]